MRTKKPVILCNAGAALTGSWVHCGNGPVNVACQLTGSATAAAVVIEVCGDTGGAPPAPMTGGPVQIATLAPTTGVGDVALFDERIAWPWMRARVTSLTGSGTVQVTATVTD